MLVYLARHLLPVSSPPVRDAAVAVDGRRIAAVGPRAEVIEAAGSDAEIRDPGPAVVLPGLVNAHAHTELSWLGDERPAGGDYVRWLRGLLEALGAMDETVARPAAERAVETMQSRGTVALGDVGNQAWIVPVLARSSLFGIAFHEIYGFRNDDAEHVLEEAAERLESLSSDSDVAAASERLSVCLTAHAPHTTSAALLRALAGRSTASGQPLSIHAAESRAECELLSDGSGPFRDLYRERGMWDDGWDGAGSSPVEYLHHLGVLSPRTLAVHCVQLQRQDHSLLQQREVTVVTCPRSNEFLGVGTAPVPELLREGIPVALGTDSLASCPDLDLFAEMAALRRLHPKLAPLAILRMATLNGARALQLADRLGTIEPGKLARLVVVPLESDGDDPLEAICSVPDRVFPLDAAPFETAAS
jgi:cytosine/adenosine deaminase-related metal-dependent hydrolase